MCFSNKGVLGLVLGMSALFGLSLGAVYNVGETVGWSSVGGFDYNNWAASKNIQVGDSIVFNYNPKFHNVRQVDSNAYQVCDASRPIASFSSGNDNVMLTNPGAFYFVCGVPGHCSNGLKMALDVVGSAATQSPPQSRQTPPDSPPNQTPPDCPPATGGFHQNPPGFNIFPYGDQMNAAPELELKLKLTMGVTLLACLVAALA